MNEMTPITLKVIIDQSGLDVNDAIVSPVSVEFTSTNDTAKPLDIAKAAGWMSKELSKKISLFKNIKEGGLNLYFYVNDNLKTTFNTKQKGINLNDQQYFYLDIMALIFNHCAGDTERKLLKKRIGFKRFEALLKLRNKYISKVSLNVPKDKKKRPKRGEKTGTQRGIIPSELLELEIILTGPRPKAGRLFKKEILVPIGGQPS